MDSPERILIRQQYLWKKLHYVLSWLRRYEARKHNNGYSRTAVKFKYKQKQDLENKLDIANRQAQRINTLLTIELANAA